jgi:hypothetical protein
MRTMGSPEQTSRPVSGWLNMKGDDGVVMVKRIESLVVFGVTVAVACGGRVGDGSDDAGTPKEHPSAASRDGGTHHAGGAGGTSGTTAMGGAVPASGGDFAGGAKGTGGCPTLPPDVVYDCMPRPAQPGDCPSFDKTGPANLGYPMKCGAIVPEYSGAVIGCQQLSCFCSFLPFGRAGSGPSEWLCPD